MSYRKKISLFILISFVGLFLGYCLTYPTNFGICQSTDDACSLSLAYSIGTPLLFGIPTITLILFILLLLPQQVFNVWKKFALFAIPLAIIWIALIPIQCSEGFTIISCLDRKLATWLASGLFLGISLIIILVKSLGKNVSESR